MGRGFFFQHYSAYGHAFLGSLTALAVVQVADVVMACTVLHLQLKIFSDYYTFYPFVSQNSLNKWRGVGKPGTIS